MMHDLAAYGATLEGSSSSEGTGGVVGWLLGVDGSLSLEVRSVVGLMVVSVGMSGGAALSFGGPGLVFRLVAAGFKLVMSMYVSVSRAGAWGACGVGCVNGWLGESGFTAM